MMFLGYYSHTCLELWGAGEERLQSTSWWSSGCLVLVLVGLQQGRSSCSTRAEGEYFVHSSNITQGELACCCFPASFHHLVGWKTASKWHGKTLLTKLSSVEQVGGCRGGKKAHSVYFRRRWLEYEYQAWTELKHSDFVTVVTLSAIYSFEKLNQG